MTQSTDAVHLPTLASACKACSQASVLVDKDGKLIECNSLANSFFLRNVKRWKAKPLLALVDCHHAATLEHLTQFETLKMLFGKATANSPMRVRLQHPSGEFHWFDLQYSATGTEDKNPVYLISFFEVNRYERMEHALHSIEKAEAISLLAGSLAHDFNNLLSLIISYADLMHSNLETHSPLRRYAQSIGSAAQKGAALMKTFASISRQDSFTELVELNLPDLVQEMENLLARAIGKHIKIVNRIDLKEAWVFGDPMQLELALLNLFINARDATQGKGLIELNLCRKEILEPLKGAPGVSGEYIVLSIQDNGTGIAPEIQSRIFEPFFTTKSSGKGTGLGLSTVKSVMERCGGFVTVDSALGHGARFDLYFPA